MSNKIHDAVNPTIRASDGNPYAMTDLGNAERLVTRYGNKIRWDVARKVWRTWDGTRWATDSALTVNNLAASTARKIREEAVAAPSGKGDGQDLGFQLFRHAVRSESRDKMAAMIEVAKSCPVPLEKSVISAFHCASVSPLALFS